MYYPDFLYPSMFSDKPISPKSMVSSMSHQDDLEPAAGVSSAAACITLSIPSKPHNPLGNQKTHYIFHPTFTHQCFDNEYIRGYEPTDAAQEQSIEKAILQLRKVNDSRNAESGHFSFRHHNRATHQLDLSIRLSPSCRQCVILIITQPKEKRNNAPLIEVQTTKNKKRNRDNSNVDYVKPIPSSSTHSSNSSACCSSSTASFSSSSSVSHPTSPAGRTRHCRMPIDEILSKISKAVPTTRYVSQDDWEEQRKTVFPVSHPLVYSTSIESESILSPKKKICGKDGIKNSFIKKDILTEIISLTSEDLDEDNILRIIDNDYLDCLIGKPLSEYSAPIRSFDGKGGSLFSRHEEEEGDFIITLADGHDPMVKEYHDQVQKLSLWFIENADAVNVRSTEGGGSWQILYLFRKHSISIDHCDAEATYSPVTITSPTHKSKSFLPLNLSPLQWLAGFLLRRSSDKKANETITQSHPLKSSKQNKYSLVGYMTLFSFSSPFKKPKGGIIQRICQVVILPPYQRAGHGKKMVQAVYDNAKQSSSLSSSMPIQPEIVEINVEDPAPAFVALRDSVDYQMIRDNCITALASHGGQYILKSPVISIIPIKYLDSECMEPLSLADATQAAILAKITPRQVQIAYEIYKLETVLKRTIPQQNRTDVMITSVESESNRGEDNDLMKKWSIMVKKRLNVSYKEIIGSCPTKEAKKAKLSQLFDETSQRYRSILGFK